MVLYLFHHGGPANASYSLHLRPPTVITRTVPSEVDGSPVTIYETDAPNVFNFCLYGMERRLKLRVPLGSVARLDLAITLLGEASR
jgi:hypothetical protein